MIPFQVSFRDMPGSDFVHNAVVDRIEKLSPVVDRAISCNVVVSSPHRHHNKGRVYHVSVHLKVPGKLLVVDREPELDGTHEDVYVAIADAFDSLERQIEHHFDKTIRGRHAESAAEVAMHVEEEA